MESPRAFCPSCQQEVWFQTTDAGRVCPQCGAVYVINTGAPPRQPVQAPGVAMTWLTLLGILMVPPVLTLVAALGRSEEASVGIALIGSALSAFGAAIWLAVRLRLSLGIRIVVAVLLLPVFYAGCFALCFAGCALGGNFKI